MSELMIEEAEVNLVTLSLTLERATIEHRYTKNNKLYVTETGMFPFWIEIHDDPTFILLRTNLIFSNDTDSTMRHDVCNSINLHRFMPSVATHSIDVDGSKQHRMEATYPIYYQDGVLTSHFIRLCRAFSNGMKEIKDELDPDNQVMIPVTRPRRA